MRYRLFVQKWAAENEKLRLKRMIKRVDRTPPRILAATFLRLPSMKGDFFALKRIMHGNIKLLDAINRIEKSHGLVQYNNNVEYIPMTKLPILVERARQIERENFHLGCKLQAIKPRMRKHKKVYKPQQIVIRRMTRLSPHTMERVSSIIPRQDSQMLGKLLRPKIFLDLDVKNIRPLGRIIIQLFTEACPDVVLEFVRMGAFNQWDLLNFIRIFPNLWIEGELDIRNEKLARPYFQHDISIVKHDLAPGILSFGESFMHNGFPYGLLNFTISFKPMSVPNGIRVAFGVVKSGARVIDCLQDYGTKNGKTKKDIVCVRAGLIT